MTVFDPSTLHLLVDDASARPFVLDLARTYQRMLGGRVDRVMAAVAAADATTDLADTLDAVLSLKVSSAMTGALELEEMARTIEHGLRRGDLPTARAQASMLHCAAGNADRALSTYLDAVPA